LVCDSVEVLDTGFVDIPNVVIDADSGEVGVCSSDEWKRVRDLPGLFVGILSHESIHLILMNIDGDYSDYLDNVASLSTIAKHLRKIGVVGRYPDGMIGLDETIEKTKEGDSS